jgi:hypothetical protein
MKELKMSHKLILAAALFGAMSTSAFAEWNLVSAVDANGCAAVEREAGAGEEKLGGPYATMEEAEAAKKDFAKCVEVNK